MPFLGQMKRSFFLSLWAICMLLPACSRAPGDKTARLAVATNFKPVMEGLRTDFETETDYRIEVSTGATGTLYAQIVNGAPYDVFLSADEAAPEKLESDGLGMAGTRRPYALGQLILWSPGDQIVTQDHLFAPDLRTLALANADLAPYGRAARQVLSALGLENQIQDKLVLGLSVGQAFAFTKTGNAELGFVALSQVLSLPAEARGQYWQVPENLYRPIWQDAILLRNGADNEAAQAFLKFLQSDRARNRIVAAGYDVP